ncbi:ABC transporter ATP-binding protein [Salipaludibacillus sp. HK11]|uniref:ABC transporter ATP-binding protein n=1 Tax=Salipaludibacillus sp. HK11 TaxID=3394320 RepID=UPI0039FC9C22
MKFEQVTLMYTGKKIFSNFSWKIESGIITCMMGSSGVGKTSLLRLASGLLKPQSGFIHKSKGRLSYIFQEPRLLPWYTVQENLMWMMDNKRKDGKRRSVLKLLDEVGLGDSASLYPNQLSGGMKQRLSIARGFISNPDVLLMDEPFQNLDSKTRADIHQILLRLWKKNKPTVLLVTHDLEEARALGHRVVYLKGLPVTIYEEFAGDKRTGSNTNI